MNVTPTTTRAENDVGRVRSGREHTGCHAGEEMGQVLMLEAFPETGRRLRSPRRRSREKQFHNRTERKCNSARG